MPKVSCCFWIFLSIHQDFQLIFSEVPIIFLKIGAACDMDHTSCPKVYQDQTCFYQNVASVIAFVIFFLLQFWYCVKSCFIKQKKTFRKSFGVHSCPLYSFTIGIKLLPQSSRLVGSVQNLFLCGIKMATSFSFCTVQICYTDHSTNLYFL